MELFTIISEIKRLEHCGTLEDIIRQETHLVARITDLKRTTKDPESIHWGMSQVFARHCDLLKADPSLDADDEINRVLIIVSSLLARRISLEGALEEIGQRQRSMFILAR